MKFEDGIVRISPKAASIRFQAEIPNERWQEDTTHWAFADGTDVEILNTIDDHARFLVGSDARVVFKAGDVVATAGISCGDHRGPISISKRALTAPIRRVLRRQGPRY